MRRRHRARTRFAAFAVLVLAPVLAAQPGLFDEAARTLAARTRIPVRLPEALPDLGQGKDRVYAIVQKADPESYSVLLAFTPDCNGGSVCRIGELSGAKQPPQPDPKSLPVRLENGLRGRWTEAECGANCSDSRIVWRQGRAWYTAAVKAGSQKDVKALAVSVARAGPKR